MSKSSITVNGVIIREIDFGESDKLITLLTAELGKITVLCRGVRTLKSRRFAAIQLFSYNEFTLAEANGKYSLTEVTIIENFFELRLKIDSTACASYAIDVVNHVTVEGQNEGEMLSLLLNTLFMLAKDTMPSRQIKGTFELRCAVILGFMPDLSQCSICGKTQIETGFYLDIDNGCLRCGQCVFENQTTDNTEQSGLLLPLESPVLSALQYIVTAPPKRIFSFSLENTLLESFGEICEKYLLNHIERGFDTLTFYKSVVN